MTQVLLAGEVPGTVSTISRQATDIAGRGRFVGTIQHMVDTAPVMNRYDSRLLYTGPATVDVC